MADWCELLPELVFEIAKALIFYEDFLSFWNVCSSWRSAVEGYNPDRLPCRFPSLMVPGEDIQDECKIYLLDGTVRKIQLPEGKLICRSLTAGWLLIIEQHTVDPKLFNPYSGCQIDLPKLDSLPRVHAEGDFGPDRAQLRQVFISHNPTVEKDFCVMILWRSGKFAFCRSGDTEWTYVKQGWSGMIEDLCYHEGKAYTFDCKGMIRSCDVNAKIQTPTLLQVSKKSLLGFEDVDVVGTDYAHILPWDKGKLLVVFHRGDFIIDDNLSEEQIRDGEYEWVFKTNSFWVFECDLETGEWSKVDNLGERAIFVGINSSFFVEACGYVKPNCIYFTHPHGRVKGTWLNKGIYHLSGGSIEPHVDVSSVGLYNKPMWIAPPCL